MGSLPLPGFVLQKTVLSTTKGDDQVSLADKLNRYGVNATVSKGKVSLEAVPTDLDALCDSEGTVTDAEFDQFLTDLDGFEAHVDAHPEGRDRGGYVVWVERNGEAAWYSESDCEWR